MSFSSVFKINRLTLLFLCAFFSTSFVVSNAQNSLNLVLPVGHTGEIKKIAVSPDNKLLASVGADRLLIIWEIESAKILRRIVLDSSQYHTYRNLTMHFSPDSKLLGLTVYASGSYSHQVVDLSSGNKLASHKGELISFGKDHVTWSEQTTASGYRILRRSLASAARPQVVIDHLSQDPFWTKAGNETNTVVIKQDGQLYHLAASTGKLQLLLNVSTSEPPTIHFLAGQIGIAEPGGAIYLFNLSTRAVTRLPGEYIYDGGGITVSSDGKFLRAGTLDKSLTWNISNYTAVASAAGIKFPSAGETISVSRETFEVEEKNGMIIARDKKSGKQVEMKATGHIHFDNEEKVAGYLGTTITILDARNAVIQHEFRTVEQRTVDRLKFSPDNSKLYATNGQLQVIGLSESRIVRTNIKADALAIAREANAIALPSNRDGFLRIVDSRTYRVLDSVTAPVVRDLQVTPDLSLITWRTFDPGLQVSRRGLPGMRYSQPRTESTVAPIFGYKLRDDGQILALTETGTLSHDVANNRHMGTGSFRGAIPNFAFGDSIVFSPNGADAYNGGIIFNIKGNNVYTSVDSIGTRDELFTISENGGFVATRTSLSEIDVLTKKGKHYLPGLRLKGHLARIEALDVSTDNALLASSAADKSIKLWNLKTGTEICTIMLLSTDDWVVLSPDGRFDASQGAMQLMYFVYGLEAIELSQLKDRFYEPNLLKRLIAEGPTPASRKQDLANLELFPDVEATIDEQNAVLKLRVTNRGGGIGKVQVHLNGKEIFEDARASMKGAPANVADQKVITMDIDLSENRHILWGDRNYIAVKAYNKGAYLKSRARKVIYDAPTRDQVIMAYKPSLYAIAIGCSDYVNDDLDLKFSSKDAEDFSTALKIAGKNLFEDRVYVSTITSNKKDPGLRPTKQNIIKAFESVAAKATTKDVFVIYLSGHGANTGGSEGDFVYLTSEASSFNLSDPVIRKNSSLSSSEITELLKSITAQKQVMIIDACASGRVVDNLIARRDIPSSTIVALDRLKDRAGTYIITGCASDAVSYEASHFGQGLLTYSLLSAMKGAALRDSRFVDVLRIFQYSRDEVPRLAEHIGGIQEPKVFSPYGGDSFDIGILETAVDKDSIPLAQPRPFFLRSSFQHESLFKDNLSIGKMFDEILSGLSQKGKASPLIFIDVNEFPQAYSLSGRYSTEGENVKINVRLFRNDLEVKNFERTGNKNNLTATVESLMSEIVQFGSVRN